MDQTSIILIIEDNSDDAELIRYAFGKAGIDNPLVMLGDGATAIAYVEGTEVYADRARYPHPALILLDLKLPRRSGFEVLQVIRRNETLKHVPIVVLTSSTQEADVARAYDLGANSYLVKPVSRDRLLEMVKSLEAFWIKFNHTISP